MVRNYFAQSRKVFLYCLLSNALPTATANFFFPPVPSVFRPLSPFSPASLQSRIPSVPLVPSVSPPSSHYSKTLSFVYFLHLSRTACISSGIGLSKNNFSPVMGWVIPKVLAWSAWRGKRLKQF